MRRPHDRERAAAQHALDRDRVGGRRHERAGPHEVHEVPGDALRDREPRCVDEDKPLDDLGIARGEVGRDEAAHRMADERRPLEPDRLGPRRELIRGDVEADRLAGSPPEAGEVDGEDPVVLGQDRDRRRPPQVAGAEAVDKHDRARGRVAAAGRTGFEPPDPQVADLRDVARLPGHGCNNVMLQPSPTRIATRSC